MDRQRNRPQRPQRKRTARNASPGILQAVGHRQLYPLFFRMGPVALSICSALLISLMAILYLSQLGQAVTTNQQIQDLRTQQSRLQRENNDLTNITASEQSPGYIAERAKAAGLVPASTSNVQVIVIPGIKEQANGDAPTP